MSVPVALRSGLASDSFVTTCRKWLFAFCLGTHAIPEGLWFDSRLKGKYQAHARVCCLWGETGTNKRFCNFGLEFLLKLKPDKLCKHSLTAVEAVGRGKKDCRIWLILVSRAGEGALSSSSLKTKISGLSMFSFALTSAAPGSYSRGRTPPQRSLAGSLSTGKLFIALGTGQRWHGEKMAGEDGRRPRRVISKLIFFSPLILHSKPNTLDPILLEALSSVKSDRQRVWKGENMGESRENVQECIIHSTLSDNEMFQMSESSR